MPVPVNEPGHSNDEDFVKRHLDCLVLNFLHEMRETAGLEAFDSVRSPFLEGGPLYPGAKITFSLSLPAFSWIRFSGSYPDPPGAAVPNNSGYLNMIRVVPLPP